MHKESAVSKWLKQAMRGSAFYYVIYCSCIHLYLPTLGFSKGLFESSYFFVGTSKQVVVVDFFVYQVC